MSRTHKVITGDTLGALGIRYLGSFSSWVKIKNANPQLVGRKKAIDGSPLIFPGDILIIPDRDTKGIIKTSDSTQVSKQIKLSDTDTEISIIINGTQFTGFTGYDIGLSYDSFDTFSMEAPYDSSITGLKTLLKPFGYNNCSVYYSGKLIFNGTLLTPDPELTDQEKTITLQGYPVCGVLNDCDLPHTKFPAQYDGQSLDAIASDMADAYGVKAIFKNDAGASFETVGYEPDKKIIDFLGDLAKQRNMLYTNNEQGNIVFFTASDTGTIGATFSEGNLPVFTLSPKYKAQDFFSHITGFSETKNENDSQSFTFVNNYLNKNGVLRCHNIVVKDAKTGSDVQNAVTAFSGRMFADCVSYDLSCTGHTNSSGDLFKKGMFVSVKSPTVMVDKTTILLARTIHLKRGTDGNTTTMNLVFPGSFTGNPPEVLPWE